MKTKGLAMGLAMVMVASLAACGGSKTDTVAPAAGSSAADTSAAESGDAAQAGEVTGDYRELSLFAASLPENTPTGGALAKMADYINENSNGTLKAIAYYDTALGDATSMVQGLQQGTVDIGVAGTAYFSGLNPEIEVFQLPFLFEDLETAREATASAAADKINEDFGQFGIVGLSFWENGFRELSNDVREVKTPADLKGIKMRVLPAEVQQKTWEALGAQTTTMDASELYTGLQTGIIDAQDNPLHEIASRKLYEVQPYVSLTDATYTPLYMAMSKTVWDALSDSQKALIKEAAEVGRKEQFDLTDKAQEEALQTLKDNGVTVTEDVDKEAFQDIAKQQWSVFTDACGTELLDMIQADK